MEIIDKSNIIWPHNATKLQNPHHANLLDVGHRFSDSQRPQSARNPRQILINAFNRIVGGL